MWALWASPNRALAACESVCSEEESATGLAHPPAWAAKKHVHFEPQTSAASAYPEAESPLEPEGEGPLLFHEAGTVQHSPTVHVIFWGNHFETTTEGKEVHSMVLKLFEGLTSSAYQGILTQYFDTTGRVSSSVSVNSYIDKSVEAPANVNGTKVEEEVASAITTNKWTIEPSAQFVVETAPGSTYEAGFPGGCAFHSYTSANAVYDFVPYQGDKQFIENGCVEIGNPSKNPIRKTSKSTSHEYAEAATDPKINAWKAGNGAEIADLCQAQEDLELPSGAWAQNQYDDHQNKCSHEDLSPPHVYAISEAATSVTSTNATLNGTVNPESTASHYYFEIGPTTSYGTRTTEVSAGSGTSNVAAKQAVCGLAASTTYHFRVAATNSTGTTYGEDKTLTTAASGGSGCPTATTEAASSVTKTEATLNGTVNPDGLETKYFFEYGTSSSYGKSTSEASAGSGTGNVKVSQAITGLTKATEYHFRLVAVNSTGATYGADKTFKTSSSNAPTVTTGSATGVTATEAIVHGNVNPNGLATTDQFEYGLTTSYGTTVPVPAESAGSGTAEIAKGYILTGLQPSTTYHFRLVATNSEGTTDGKDATFTTAGLTPTFSSSFGSSGTGNGQFNEPTGIAVNPINGNVVVSDEKNNRVQVFNEKGEFVRTFGSEGTGNGQFKEPRGVAVDSKGNVWVTDTGNNRVEEFNEKGEYVSQFGTKGTGNGQFTEPKGLALDSKGDIWVADSGNKRIEEFNEKSEYVRQFSTGTNPIGVTVDAKGNVWNDDEAETGAIEEHNEKGEFVQKFASRGSGNGQVEFPKRLAIDANGFLWVADAGNNRVDVFNEKGEYVTKFGSLGSGSEQMKDPTGVAVDPRGDVWVADDENNRVDKWKTSSPWPPTFSSSFGSSGTGNGQFNEPTGIAVNPINGNVVVSDEKNNRVQVFNEKGEFVRTFGSEGTGNGQFKEPRGVAVDSKGNVWVTDTGNNRVEEFNEKGEYVSQFGTKGTGNGQFTEPKGLALDSKGDIWVADSGNKRIEEFNEKSEYVRQFSTGTNPIGVTVDAKGNVWNDDEAETGAIEEHNEKGEFVQKFASRGSGNGQVSQPKRLAFDTNGHLWVADGSNDRIEVFNEKGEYVTTFGTYGTGSEQMKYPTGVAVDPRGNVWIADDENNRVDKWTR
jgi:DNA-binding beta-propeller fold protein YncE